MSMVEISMYQTMDKMSIGSIALYYTCMSGDLKLNLIYMIIVFCFTCTKGEG